MIKLGHSYKGIYTLVMSNDERLQLESHVVDNYFCGQKVDSDAVQLIKKAISIYPDNN